MIFIHPTAEIEKGAKIGTDTKIWHYVQIRRGAIIGKNCVLGKSVYVDHDVSIGNNCKIQNRASLYYGLKIEDGVFIGPDVCFANDKLPRAITISGTVKSEHDWEVGNSFVKYGASIGAGSTILPGIIIGSWAMIGAGSVVTANIPDYGLVYGNPARLKGYVCDCGRRLTKKPKGRYYCNHCLKFINID